MSFYLEISSEILNPTIFIGKFEIREPVTTLTDFLTACVSGVCFLFHKKNNSRSFQSKYFQFYFLLYFIGMTSAAFLGHALQAYVPKEVKIIGWVFSTTAQFFLALGSLYLIKKIINKKQFKILYTIIISQSLIFIFLMIFPLTSDFKVAQVSASFAMIGIIFPIHIYNYYKTRSSGSKWIIFSILYALIPAYVYNNELSISIWFNYHDISHVLMSVFMLLMYFATKELVNKEVLTRG